MYNKRGLRSESIMDPQEINYPTQKFYCINSIFQWHGLYLPQCSSVFDVLKFTVNTQKNILTSSLSSSSELSFTELSSSEVSCKEGRNNSLSYIISDPGDINACLKIQFGHIEWFAAAA